MFNVRLAGDHMYEKWLFTWLWLVMSLMVSYFVLFPMRCLGRYLGLIESVSENFRTYFYSTIQSLILHMYTMFKDCTLHSS